MRQLRAWIEDCVGGAIAEIEAWAPRRPPKDAVRWAPGEGRASSDMMLDSADCLLIRRPVRAGARLYLAQIARSIVETSWPFSGEPPVWSAALERRGEGWEIAVYMMRPDLMEAIRREGVAKGTPVRRLWFSDGAGPAIQPPSSARKISAARLRLAAAITLCVFAIGAPVYEVAIAGRAKAAIAELAEEARLASAPARDALRAARAAELADAALAQAASAPGLTRLLADLALALPGRARLTSVVVKPTEIRLDGRAPSATAVLAAYADAPGLSGVRFDGAVSAAPSGGERFSIVAKRVAAE